MQGPVNSYLARARGVLIFPDLLRAGFIVGAEGGTEEGAAPEAPEGDAAKPDGDAE